VTVGDLTGHSILITIIFILAAEQNKKALELLIQGLWHGVI
jgi:hypothetical protein